MKTFRSVNWFRLLVVIGLSVTTSLSMFYGDGILAGGEVFNALLQAAIAGLAFLQCPEDGRGNNPQTRKGEINEK